MRSPWPRLAGIAQKRMVSAQNMLDLRIPGLLAHQSCCGSMHSSANLSPLAFLVLSVFGVLHAESISDVCMLVILNVTRQSHAGKVGSYQPRAEGQLLCRARPLHTQDVCGDLQASQQPDLNSPTSTERAACILAQGAAHQQRGL